MDWINFKMIHLLRTIFLSGLLWISMVPVFAQNYIKSFQKQKYETAAEQADAAIDRNKDNLEAYYYKAWAYYEMFVATEPYKSGFSKCMKTFTQMLKRDGASEFVIAMDGSESFMLDLLAITEENWEANTGKEMEWLQTIVKLLPTLKIRIEHANLLRRVGDPSWMDVYNGLCKEIFTVNKKKGKAEKFELELFLEFGNALMDSLSDPLSGWIILARGDSISGKMAFYKQECIKIFKAFTENYRIYNVEEEEMAFIIQDIVSKYAEDPDWNLVVYEGLRENLQTTHWIFDAEGHHRLMKMVDIWVETAGTKTWYDSLFVHTLVDFLIKKTYAELVSDKKEIADAWMKRLLPSAASKFGDADYIKFLEQMNPLLNMEQKAYIISLLNSIITAKPMKKIRQDYLNMVIADNTIDNVEKIRLFDLIGETVSTNASIKSTFHAAIKNALSKNDFSTAGKYLSEAMWAVQEDLVLMGLHKEWVEKDYKMNYTGSIPPSDMVIWNGDVSTCNAGTPIPKISEMVLKRLNYVRRLAGVPNQSVWEDSLNTLCMKAALMMEANNALSHEPKTDWVCYSEEGKRAAMNSNLSLGVNTVGGLQIQVADAGLGNYFVGHRRWILKPSRKAFGYGSTNNAMALWVFSPKRYEEEEVKLYFEQPVAWPAPGYFPSDLIYARWSFSLVNADFSKATVEVKKGKENIAVKMLKYEGGYGENTIVWEPENLNGVMQNAVYTVTVKNVILYDGRVKDYVYKVYPIVIGN